MCASAGLHVTSQASRIIARRGALIGSIGTYAILVDSSAYAEEQGIKVHVIKAGEHKGVGTWGAPITEAQLAEIQSRVDRAAATFVAAVASGRRMSVARVQALATGATWEADEAMSLGLIDEIEATTRHDVIAFLTHVAEIVGPAVAGVGGEGQHAVVAPFHDLAGVRGQAQPGVHNQRYV